MTTKTTDFYKEWQIQKIIEILRGPIFGLDYLTGLYRGLLLRRQLQQEELEQEETESMEIRGRPSKKGDTTSPFS